MIGICTFNRDSDIDLAIVLGDKSNSFELSIVLRRKEETIIEPHLFDQSEFNASNQIAAEILKTGMEFKLS